MQKFGILLLAAGQSRRFGADKLLASMPDGRPVIAHSLEPLQAFADAHKLPLCVVTRADNAALVEYLKQQKVPFTLCPDAQLGMGNSIAHGVKSNPSWSGWMITLADMPNLKQPLLEDLFRTIKVHEQDIVRPKIVTKDSIIPTHPVYFPSSYANKLIQLSGDNGAKHIIQQVRWLTVEDGSRFIDVDTPNALQSLHRQKKERNS